MSFNPGPSSFGGGGGFNPGFATSAALNAVPARPGWFDSPKGFLENLMSSPVGHALQALAVPRNLVQGGIRSIMGQHVSLGDVWTGKGMGGGHMLPKSVQNSFGGWGGRLAGLGIDLATDPLMWVTGGGAAPMDLAETANTAALATRNVGMFSQAAEKAARVASETAAEGGAAHEAALEAQHLAEQQTAHWAEQAARLNPKGVITGDTVRRAAQGAYKLSRDEIGAIRDIMPKYGVTFRPPVPFLGHAVEAPLGDTATKALSYLHTPVDVLRGSHAGDVLYRIAGVGRMGKGAKEARAILMGDVKNATQNDVIDAAATLHGMRASSNIARAIENNFTKTTQPLAETLKNLDPEAAHSLVDYIAHSHLGTPQAGEAFARLAGNDSFQRLASEAGVTHPEELQGVSELRKALDSAQVNFSGIDPTLQSHLTPENVTEAMKNLGNSKLADQKLMTAGERVQSFGREIGKLGAQNNLARNLSAQGVLPLNVLNAQKGLEGFQATQEDWTRAIAKVRENNAAKINVQADSIARSTVKNGGTSYSMEEGRLLNPKAYGGNDSGYMVGANNGTGASVPLKDFNAQSIKDFAQQHADELAGKGAHIGTEVVEKDGQQIVNIDVAHRTNDVQRAVAEGRLHGQERIFNMKTGESHGLYGADSTQTPAIDKALSRLPRVSNTRYTTQNQVTHALVDMVNKPTQAERAAQAGMVARGVPPELARGVGNGVFSDAMNVLKQEAFHGNAGEAEAVSRSALLGKLPDGTLLPHHVAVIAQAAGEAGTQNGLQKVLNHYYDPILQLWKKYQLLGPGKAVRHIMMGGIGMHIMDVAAADLPHLASLDAFAEHALTLPAAEQVKFLTENVANQGERSAIAKMLQLGVKQRKVAGESFGDIVDVAPTPTGAVKERLSTIANYLPEKNMALQGRVLDKMRGMAFLDGVLNKGFDPIVSMGRVQQFLFNTSELTQLERTTAARLIPFYAFLRTQLPMAADVMMNNPRKFIGVMALQHNLMGRPFDTPQQIEEANKGQEPAEFLTSALQEPLGFRSGGSQVYGGLDTPFGKLNEMGTDIGHQHFGALFGDVTPAVSLPLEMMTHQNFFTGFGLGTKYTHDLPWQNIPGVAQAIQRLPGVQGGKTTGQTIHILETLLPQLQQARRVFPSGAPTEDVYRGRALSARVRYLMGVLAQANDPQIQSIGASRGGR